MDEQTRQLIKELGGELKENILERYNNSEYWDESIIEDFFITSGIKDDERQNEIRAELDRG